MKTRLVLLTILLFAASALAQQQIKTSSRRVASVNYIRLVNTAENLVKQKRGKYIPIKELLGSEEMKTARQMLAKMRIETGSEALKETDLTLTLSADQNEYSVILTDTTDSCLYTVSSTQAGKIYHGKVINCDIGESKTEVASAN